LQPYEKDNCPDKSNGVAGGICFELFLQLLNIGLYIWARLGERWTLKKAEEFMGGKPCHKDDAAPTFPQSRIDGRYPMRLLQSVSFVVSYGFAQKIAARRIYADEFGGRYGNHLSAGEAAVLIIGYFFLWILQIFIQSETVLTCTTVLALPPYVDETNRNLAIAVAGVYDDHAKNDFKKAAEVLGLPVEMLKEHLMDEYLANQDAKKVEVGVPSMGGDGVEMEEQAEVGSI